MTPEEYQRKGDAIIGALVQRVNDFIERYDRDCGANNEWRKNVDLVLEKQNTILSEISPAYARGKWIAGIIVLGSLGIAVKAFWQHISFH